ncbi:asparagine synthase (glutamine-hydrolyzing) [Roseomonas nepalensis]|uniref:asparagine synthase (glutamine-hydrolyzing) n=1 Tax=Muricoccus nepalensis TaxID=1854500 RepID=A0A502GG36_9PROT|nr:asparagine synthase (glutamine-hydrolyzing) [Roseomonas nepalensis]TPG61089.1 asparagine synthase (glutamine-hydrolyzing) [Roseomonas nepalensis]
MCGIVGLFSPGFRALPEGADLRRMADALRHRGPDGAGYHEEPGLGLGHRRLAIVDLGGGAQPMATPDGGVVISFNGEIYNHLALRRELEAAGHRFRTHSDTEAILHAWTQWGTGCLERLNGMFAFALWDRAQGKLLLARDRLGEKPLLYLRRPAGGIAFSSELGALLALPDVRRRLDPAAVEDFLALGYVPDPHCIYQDILKLPAAHFLLLSQDAPPSAPPPPPQAYWRPPTAASAAPADAVGDLAGRLRASVRDRLMSDVPLGAFLSGGVDSGTVVAMAAEASTTPLATFTMGFPGSADERPRAAQIAEAHGTRHHAEVGSADYLAAARRQAAIFGEPFGDHSAVPTLAVCAMARKHVTVALSGDGGDEVFAGYRRYRFHTLAEAARRLLPASLRRSAVAGLARAYPTLARAPRWLRAKSTLTELSLDSAAGYYRTVCKLQDERRRALFSPGLRSALAGHDPSDRFVSLMAECDPDEPLLQAQYADLHTYLPGDILTKVDRTSMAVSLEVRPPLLDPDLVGFGLALPASLKLRGGVGKQLLREVAAPLLPPAVLSAPKQGFADRIGDQFRSRAAELRARFAGEAMMDSGLFDGARLTALVDEHETGGADHSQALWQLLVFEGFLAGEAPDLGGLARERDVVQA